MWVKEWHPLLGECLLSHLCGGKNEQEIQLLVTQPKIPKTVFRKDLHTNFTSLFSYQIWKLCSWKEALLIATGPSKLEQVLFPLLLVTSVSLCHLFLLCSRKLCSVPPQPPRVQHVAHCPGPYSTIVYKYQFLPPSLLGLQGTEGHQWPEALQISLPPFSTFDSRWEPF